MATALTTNISASLIATLTQGLDLGTAQLPANLAKSFAWPNGTGANQADRIFTDIRTLGASGAEDLDLAGVLTDGLGNTISFARVRALIVAADVGNTNNVIVGGASSNGFISWVGAATHTVTVRPGGLLVLVAPDAPAYAVTAATADLLHIANSAGTTGVTYSVAIIGASV